MDSNKTNKTELREAESLLRESEVTARLIFESLPLGMHMYRLEPDGRLVFTGANPAADLILGVDNSIFIGKTIEEAFPPLKATEVPQRYREAAAAGKVWHTEQIEYHEGTIQGAFEVYAFQTAPNTMVAAFEDITTRKQSEAALKQSEEKYRRLYNETPVLLHSIDRSGILVEVNDHWLKTMGYERNEVLGRKVSDFYTEASRKYAEEVIQPAFFRLGSAKDVAYQFVTKNGDLLDMLLSATAERDAAGNAVRSQAVIEDVTLRKRAQEELRKSEGRFQYLVEQSPLAISSIDKTGRIEYTNKKHDELVGFTGEEIPTLEAWWALVYPDAKERQRIMTAWKDLSLRIFSGEDVGPIERTIVCKDGLRRDVEMRFSLTGENILAFFVDITERKRAGEALHENQARLDLALQSAHMGVWRWEIRENRRYFDDLVCHILGIEAAVFTGTAEEFFRAVHPEDREKIKSALSRTVEQDLPYEVTYRVVWPDNSVRYIASRGRLVRDDKGQPARIHGILWDITDQYLLEQERIRAQKLESVGTLAGGIAHDFNNLLQGIFGYISLAKMTIDQKDKAVAMLVQAEKALHQSVNLTSQLLTFSKGGKPVKKTIDLRPAIENAVKFALSGSRITADLSFAADLHTVEADEGQISQVVQNIVLNADQAMPLGGRIALSARNILASDTAGLPDELKGDLVEITIEDEGTGIPVEHRSSIFDPYFTTKERGSGLGLATSYSIIKYHGGVINVSSELGKGSTFTIYLPASSASIALVAPSGEPAAGRKGRILIMDDENLVREVAGALINSLGHEVAFAEHGESAISQYCSALDAGRPFDVVVLDLTIKGGMGGLETLQKLLLIDPEVKAVVSSGYADNASMSDYQAKGFKAFLKKPYNRQNLSSILNDMLV
jgi:PAS domain S-box-containing protein